MCSVNSEARCLWFEGEVLLASRAFTRARSEDREEPEVWLSWYHLVAKIQKTYKETVLQPLLVETLYFNKEFVVFVFFITIKLV